ncbi:alpha/beta hydrolase [Amnibacterium setariae]|uniref:Alpha/beta hydrolase n=1 Tax=Amnibacterium setariae TaxID=2306585 RepID=A0A3A1TXQ9_9MICO|nr:alpha/beta hydrolase [Amnibacterium setariae]RIX28982.1 alpha/beta hydrolase [Amnibacterium setariae]
MTDFPESSSATGAPALVQRSFTTPRHSTAFLESGPVDGPLLILLHGWPSIGLIWRAQLEAFAADGWHCVAPDLRGFGASSAPADRAEYTIEEVVTDMVELHDHLGGAPAVWAGHDWGSVVAGAVAAHEPDRARAVVLVSLAYQPSGHALDTIVPLVDRSIYPADEYPDGQWDYYRFYTTDFETAVGDLDADPAASLASIYRAGDPAAVGRVAPHALVTRNHGRFGSAHRAPATPPDPSLWPPADFERLVDDFTATGFGPSSAWYVNDDADLAYARRAPEGGRLRQPVLFVNGAWDVICTVVGNRQGDPMRDACADLTVVDLESGHWSPLERKVGLVDVMRTWFRDRGLRPDDGARAS